MKDFLLPKTGGLAAIDVLDESDITDVLALHETARAALPADKKHFVPAQGTAFYQNFLSRQTGLMIGIRYSRKIIAQMTMESPMPLREAIALHVITNNDIRYFHASLDDNIVVFRSIETHPEFRGNNLEQYLLNFASELPFAHVADHLFAQVAANDKRVWNAYASFKFGIVGAAYDTQDKQPRFIFQKPAFGFDLVPDLIADEVDPMADFPAIIALTQREGLVGYYESGSKERLSFLRNREANNLMPFVARATGKK